MDPDKAVSEPHASINLEGSCMKKLVLPLAMLGGAACGLASAQSTVTIYGVVDMGITKADSGTALNPGRGGVDQWGVQQGNASRLGFIGREDLGGGLYARFALEHRFNPDTGVPATPIWQGRSVVALGSDRWGEVFLGRDYMPWVYVSIAGDPTGWNYVSQGGQAFTYANYGSSGPTDGSVLRRNNMVNYRSPKFGGLSTELSVAPGEGVRKRDVGANLQYAAGALYAGVGIDRIDGDNNFQVWTLGYDFGVAKPTLLYAMQKTLGVRTSSATLGVSVPLGLGRVYALLGRLDPRGANNDARKLGLGGEYLLSRRSTLYANVGAAAQDTKTRSTAFDLGLKHTF
jgi:predicted porin